MQHILENSPEPSISFLAPIGYQTGDCGYCKKEDQSTSFYATSKSLRVEHYQALVDRGWRRSGTLFYKPDLRHSCCPHYTIRLPARDFKPRKDQRQAVNRWNKHVLGDDYQKELGKRYPKSKIEKAQSRSGFNLLTAVHESEYLNLPQPPPEPAHKFEVELELDKFTEEKYKLYENYQQHVHGDPPHKITRAGFTRFLCDSPLQQSETPLADGKSQKLGSFHQCYRLDGRLIAMAVLDLLPHCVSGVYFIYHSDFEKFGFGKISAVREAALALEGGYDYYYMGFYIHSCAKMRYKNDYYPQYILDLETMQWDPLDDAVRKLLDDNHYVSVSLAKSAAEEVGTAPDPALEHGQAQDDETKDDTGKGVAKAGTGTNQRRIFESAIEVYDAVEVGVSLFDIEFAGMMTAEELEKTIDLDKILVRIKKDVIVHGEDFVKWKDWSIHDCGDNSSIKSAIAHLAACVGPEVVKDLVVSFGG